MVNVTPNSPSGAHTNGHSGENGQSSENGQSAATAASPQPPEVPMVEPIAVVGLSCRFPEANNAEEFWDLLKEGKSAIKDLPAERSQLAKKSIEGHMKRGGFLKCPVDEFDAKFFGVSSREAPFMDPQQRLLLEVTWEALENAGINPQSLKGTEAGVFIGIWTTDYNQILSKSSYAGECEVHDSYLGSVLSAVAARISFFLGSYGPNLAIDAGCASSLQSVHLACDSLRRRETDVAIAGGVNLILGSKVGKVNSMILALDGHCKTFDAKADGFGRADGCGILILKRLVDAQRDGDTVLALIRGSAINCDGSSANYGSPCKLAQAKVIRNAMRLSKVDPKDVNYIEAHGTGTQIGDPIEFQSLNSVFSKKRSKPLIVGSVKTNIGHSEAAAGVAGLIKIILSLKNELIPPHLNFKTLNPDIDLKSIPAIIPTEAVPWPRSDRERRIAGISAFALTGHNAHIIVEEAPNEVINVPAKVDPSMERPVHLLALSAKTDQSLQDLVTCYLEFLKTSPEIPITDVAFTANSGRGHFSNRLVVSGKSSEDIKSNLENKLYTSGVATGQASKTAYLFTDENTKFLGISKILYETHPVFRNALDKCSHVLSTLTDLPLFESIWRSEKPSEPIRTSNPVAVFCVQYSLFYLWKSFGIEPDYVLGYGTGEFAAAAVAGILSLEDALKLVVQTSFLTDKLPAGSILAVKSSKESVKKLMQLFINNYANMNLDISAINAAEETVIVGNPEAIKLFSEICFKNGCKTRRINGTHLLHSREVNNILGEFIDVASTVCNNNTTVKYVSGTTGKLLGDTHFMYDDEYWQNLLRKPVNFSDGVKTLVEQGCKIFIEVGPHPVLLGHLMENLPTHVAQHATWVPSLRHGDNEWNSIFSSLSKLYIGGADIDWKKYDEPYNRKRVALPTYPFQRQKYWAE